MLMLEHMEYIYRSHLNIMFINYIICGISYLFLLTAYFPYIWDIFSCFFEYLLILCWVTNIVNFVECRFFFNPLNIF